MFSAGEGTSGLAHGMCRLRSANVARTLRVRGLRNRDQVIRYFDIDYFIGVLKSVYGRTESSKCGMVAALGEVRGKNGVRFWRS